VNIGIHKGNRDFVNHGGENKRLGVVGNPGERCRVELQGPHQVWSFLPERNRKNPKSGGV